MKKYLSLILFFLISFVNQAQIVFYNQDFESGSMPFGWSQTTNASDGGWLFGTASVLSSNYFGIIDHTKIAATNDDGCNCDKSADLLIMPTFDFSVYTAVFMDASVFYNDETYQGTQEKASIEVSTNSGNTWTTLVQLSGSSQWQDITVDLSAYAGQSNVLIAFKYSDSGGWLYGLALDDVSLYQPFMNDASITDLSTPDFVLSGNYDVAGTIKNLGVANISSITVNWSVNNGSIHTQNITGINIPSLGSYTFTHTTQLNIPAPGAYNLKVWTSDPNAATDANPANDTVNKLVSGLSSLPDKKVLVEEFTGAWCGWCPDGAVILGQILDANTNAIGVSVHSGDDMEFTEGGDLATEYAPFYPSGLIDRYLFSTESEVGLDRGTWVNHFAERSSMIVPVSVSLQNVQYDTSTRQLVATVKADFVGPVENDLRLNLLISEDSVTGSGSGYDQVNYFSANNNYPNHPFFNLPDPIVGYKHNHCLRAMLGGTWGSNGIIPSSVNDGDSYSKEYTTTIPVGWNIHNLQLVGLVQEYNTDKVKRNILNADNIELKSILNTGIDDLTTAALKGIYPNPFADRTQIDFYLAENTDVEISIYDLAGRKIKTLLQNYLGSGYHAVYWNGTDFEGVAVNNGIYMLSITTKDSAISRKIIVQR